MFKNRNRIVLHRIAPVLKRKLMDSFMCIFSFKLNKFNKKLLFFNFECVSLYTKIFKPFIEELDILYQIFMYFSMAIV